MTKQVQSRIKVKFFVYLRGEVLRINEKEAHKDYKSFKSKRLG